MKISLLFTIIKINKNVSFFKNKLDVLHPRIPCYVITLIDKIHAPCPQCELSVGLSNLFIFISPDFIRFLL